MMVCGGGWLPAMVTPLATFQHGLSGFDTGRPLTRHAMSAFNSFMNSLFSVIWIPFQSINPWIGLTVLSVLIGILALLGMKYLSNQDAISLLKDRYKAHVLAIRLFRDDLGIVLKSLFRTLGYIGRYMGHQLRPMIILIIPVIFVFAQLQMRLAYQPLELGDKVNVTVEMAKGTAPGADNQVTADLPDGVEIAGPVVPVPSKDLVLFPLKVTKAGPHELKFHCGDETVVKSMHVANPDDLTSLAPVRSSGWLDLLLYPTEPKFDEGSHFARIFIPYSIKPLNLFGFDFSFQFELGMGLMFMAISIIAAFALKGVFNVEI